jgi:pSer/pThr/pTyr-binding forkhead associated (FHA) protein
MGDPRLNGSHLDTSRHDQYDASVNEMLDGRGPATADADPLARSPKGLNAPIRREALPPEGTYTLVSLTDGRRHLLRVGINTVGRFPENNVVLEPNSISRRHCVVLVHATGACEVYDTASRNGTWVNNYRTGRVSLLPGDVLMISNQKYVLGWFGPDGEVIPPGQGAETMCRDGLSPTG